MEAAWSRRARPTAGSMARPRSGQLAAGSKTSRHSGQPMASGEPYRLLTDLVSTGPLRTELVSTGLLRTDLLPTGRLLTERMRPRMGLRGGRWRACGSGSWSCSS
jgi:hypothetical protein